MIWIDPTEKDADNAALEKRMWSAADQVRANSPFNDSDWFRKDHDVRWPFGVQLKDNANFAWVQRFIHHLAPQSMAGFVLANGSMSSNQSGDCNARSARREWATDSQGLGSQRDIRRALIEADLVDCMVALPGQLFYSTQIPVCLWFLAKNKHADAKRGRSHRVRNRVRQLHRLRMHRDNPPYFITETNSRRADVPTD